MITVLIAHSKKVEAMLIQSIIKKDSNFSVLEVAKNGPETLRLCLEYSPDLVFLDDEIQYIDLMNLIHQITHHKKTHVLLLSNKEWDRQRSRQAYDAGVEEFLPIQDFFDAQKSEVKKVQLLNRFKYFEKNKKQEKQEKQEKKESPKNKVLVTTSKLNLPPQKKYKKSISVIGVVASTGGPPVLEKVLKMIGSKFSTPILVVQHIREGFVDGLVASLNNRVDLPVKVAENNERIHANMVYFAPYGIQMHLSPLGVIQLKNEAPVEGQQPSGTVLLNSLAENFGADALGIVLTGMGRDGAQGLKSLRDAGGLCFVQEPQTAAVDGMPQAAIELGAAEVILSPENLAEQMLELDKMSQKGKSNE